MIVIKRIFFRLKIILFFKATGKKKGFIQIKTSEFEIITAKKATSLKTRLSLLNLL